MSLAAGHAPDVQPPSGGPSILVVVPALNEAAHIEAVLRSLNADPPPGLRTHFVVADGGSTDGTQAIVQRLASSMGNLSLLHNPMRRQGAGVNLAVERHGQDRDILVRCDAHASYPPNYIASLVKTLDRVGSDAVVVPMDSAGHTCLQKAVAWLSDTAVGSGNSAHRGGRSSGFVDHGHHAAFRMSSFIRAGGYDDAFTPNEDAELDCRQLAQGSKIYLDADIRMTYYPRTTLARLSTQYLAYGRARMLTIRRHPGSLRLRQLAVPVHVLLTLAALLGSTWTAWALLWPAFYLLVLIANALVLTLRHRSACALLAVPAAIVMHFSWGFGLLQTFLGGRKPGAPVRSVGPPPPVAG